MLDTLTCVGKFLPPALSSSPVIACETASPRSALYRGRRVCMTRYTCAASAPFRHEMTLICCMSSSEVSYMPITACRKEHSTKPFQAYSKYYGAGDVATDERASPITSFDVPQSIIQEPMSV